MYAFLAAALIRYVTIGTDAFPEVHAADADARLVSSDGQVAVVEIHEEDLEELSALMHEHHDRCGGYMVHDTLEEALAQDAPTRGPVEYTIDRGATVRWAIGHIDAAQILKTIAELSSMQNRYYQSKHGAEASLWLQDKWQKLAAGRDDVTIELFDQGYPQKSVIMTIRGTTKPDEVIVIGGHLDSIALGGKAANAPGADDDASGVATLTEVARVLLQEGYRPDRTIKFMAYAAEEVGLRGSLAIARDFQKRKVNVVGALQLDMTNYQGSDKDIWLMKDFTDAKQNAFMVQLIERYVNATYGFDACGYACSDHASWTRIGVPASMPFESRMNERNKQIHTKKDTLELSANNAQHAAKFARLGAAYAIELGKGGITNSGQPHSDAQLTLPDFHATKSSDSSSDTAAIVSLLLLVAGFAMSRRIV
ncbi:MAG TPA: M20/M25/M40 family metallo-hydrolase [Kofleriaceae bacterium]|nr:M20/M25/M40 family metallo-hydrolase [Kofleriaceae bacterium]